MKRALVLASVASMIDQFNMSNIEILKELGYEVHVVANFQYGSTTSQERVDFIKNKLIKMNIKVYDIEINRNVFSLGNLKAYKEIKKLIEKENYNLIHCHSPIGGVMTRIAARKLRKKGTKVIYTAHGFHFYKGAPLKNWVLFYPVEKWLARYTDVLITINQEDYRRAKKAFKAKQIEYIPGIGIDTEKINNITVNVDKKRKELGIPRDAFIVLSVGELNKNKNHEVIIKAIAEINDPNIYYIICGQGELKDYLRKLANELGLEDRIKLLGYRKDVFEISKASDVFAFPSFREGLSVALMEAMACGLPVVCSNIRGNVDLIEDDKNGYLSSPYNIAEFSKNIIQMRQSENIVNKAKQCNAIKIALTDKKSVNEQIYRIYKSIL